MVQAGGVELRDLASATRGNCNVEYLSTDQTTSGAFIHGKEAAAPFPVPATVVMDVIDANFSLQLWLAPKTRAIRRDAHRRVETGQFEFAILTDQLDPRLVVGVFAEVILGQQFET